MKVSVHSHETTCHSGIVPAEQANITITKLILFWFKYRIWLLIYPRPKKIAYCLVRSINLVHNWYIWNIIDQERNGVLNSTYYSQLRIIKFQKISSKLYIWISIEHINIGNGLRCIILFHMFNKCTTYEGSIYFYCLLNVLENKKVLKLPL